MECAKCDENNQIEIAPAATGRLRNDRGNCVAFVCVELKIASSLEPDTGELGSLPPLRNSVSEWALAEPRRYGTIAMGLVWDVILQNSISLRT